MFKIFITLTTKASEQNTDPGDWAGDFNVQNVKGHIQGLKDVII